MLTPNFTCMRSTYPTSNPLSRVPNFLACKFKLFVLYVPGTGIQPVGPTPDPQLLRTVVPTGTNFKTIFNFILH